MQGAQIGAGEAEPPGLPYFNHWGAYDAPPDPLVGWEGIGSYGASILVPSALALAPAALCFCRWQQYVP